MPDKIHEIVNAYRPEFFSLAFLGSLVALSFWSPRSKRAAFVNVISGTVISVASAPVVYEILTLEWPSLEQNISILGAIYFWIGLFGMKIVPIAESILDRIRGVKIKGVDE